MRERYQMKKMSDAIGLQVNKNPYINQYVCVSGYHFVKDGENLGRIIWRKPTELDGIYIDKDEED